MAILNSKFAFLEADFENPNLNKMKSKIESFTLEFEENVQVTNKFQKEIQNPKSIYIKTVPLFMYANNVPADIYSAALFLLIKNL